ncbi:hypothetical protein [Cellulomonas taurus]|uniref:hypothetical protein n=1 Tax=Cellulomonas taurus TaxID=2729175 RepID=UPI00145DF95F|nr:hypothetical protein [Cellulomonas taurus]
MRALRYFDLIDPIAVMRWAELWASRDEGTGAVIDLAAMSAPLAQEVDSALEDLCEQLGLPPVSTEAAAMTAAVDAARDLVEGRVDPTEAAHRIWTIADLGPIAAPRLRVFIGLASEWDDNPEFRDSYDAQIRHEAALLAGES